jgi:choice-of-anchor A domain-containing protein
VGPCLLCFNLHLGEAALFLLESSLGAAPEEDKVADRFTELRNLSARLARLPASGSTAFEVEGTLALRGVDPSLNVFQVEASDFTDVRRLSIDAPAGSLVVVNIHGESASFTSLGHAFRGGIDTHGVLYNFVEATDLRAMGSDFWGTLLAPYAHVDFNRGSWEGGLYAVSFTGDAEGHLSPLTDRELCP